MSVTELENPSVCGTMNPHILYDQINKAYEEYKHLYQDYDPTKLETYQSLFTRLGDIYEYFIRNRTSYLIFLRLIQEISQFMLELELSPYL